MCNFDDKFDEKILIFIVIQRISILIDVFFSNFFRNETISNMFFTFKSIEYELTNKKILRFKVPCSKMYHSPNIRNSRNIV